MSDLVEFRHLKYIAAIAETNNFTRAAERLFLAQPSLSKQIKELEDAIGFPIFTRTREGVRITPAGEMVIAYAQEALMARLEIITMARAVHQGEVPPLRLGFSSFINPNLLQLFRDCYANAFPNCRIQLSGGDPIHILQRLEQETLDGALLPMPIEGEAWVVQQVAQVPLVVCMRSDDPLTREPAVELCALPSRLKIFQDPELHPAGHAKLIEMFAEMGFKLDMVCTASTSSDIQWMVRAGYGVALIDQGTALDPVLTTRQIAGVHWTADTAFVHHREGGHIALRFVTRFLQRIWKRTLRKRPVARKDDAAVQLDLLA
jgi:DNA-binding transcriptional LysR family regulator